MFRSLDISTSGLTAQRQRMDVIAGNIAHVNTTRDEHGQPNPFRRRITTFHAEASTLATAGRGIGVEFETDFDRSTPMRKVQDPGHPDADRDGYVSYPNVNLVTEFVNAIEASRAYEANIAAIELTKQMMQNTFQILT